MLRDAPRPLLPMVRATCLPREKPASPGEMKHDLPAVQVRFRHQIDSASHLGTTGGFQSFLDLRFVAPKTWSVVLSPIPHTQRAPGRTRRVLVQMRHAWDVSRGGVGSEECAFALRPALEGLAGHRDTTSAQCPGGPKPWFRSHPLAWHLLLTSGQTFLFLSSSLSLPAHTLMRPQSHRSLLPQKLFAGSECPERSQSWTVQGTAGRACLLCPRACLYGTFFPFMMGVSPGQVWHQVGSSAGIGGKEVPARVLDCPLVMGGF